VAVARRETLERRRDRVECAEIERHHRGTAQLARGGRSLPGREAVEAVSQAIDGIDGQWRGRDDRIRPGRIPESDAPGATRTHEEDRHHERRLIAAGAGAMGNAW